MSKKGFIATSMMYSFFIVFALLALTILSTYSHYRYLSNDMNSSIADELNNKTLNKYARLYNLVKNGNFESGNSNWSRTNAETGTKSDTFSVYSGDKAMVMPTTGTASNFYQNVNTSSLKAKEDNKVHKIYIRFRSFKKNSLISNDSDVCVTIDTKRCYSTYYYNYLRNNYSVTPSLSGKIFFADGAPEIAATGYNPYNWALHSEIIDVTFNNANVNKNWKLEFYINNKSGPGQVYIDDVMLIDVTSVFTRENTNATYDYTVKQYLDENLNYYDGNYVLGKCNRASVGGKWICA